VGVPAIFSSRIFDELRNLSTATGAKQIIKKYAPVVEKIPVPEAAFDIDTRADYESLIEHKNAL
jgi:molybdenum cofactor cytidylyltransferase